LQQPDPALPVHTDSEPMQRSSGARAQQFNHSTALQPAFAAPSASPRAEGTRPLRIVADEEIAWLFAD
jgi:hypothetical protein